MKKCATHLVVNTRLLKSYLAKKGFEVLSETKLKDNIPKEEYIAEIVTTLYNRCSKWGGSSFIPIGNVVVFTLGMGEGGKMRMLVAKTRHVLEIKKKEVEQG